MAVVDIREVRVAVLQRHMLVRMGMRLNAIPCEIVAVLMVPIVPMAVRML